MQMNPIRHLSLIRVYQRSSAAIDSDEFSSKLKSRGPSVIQVRTQDVLPSAIGVVVLRAIEASREHLETGAIVTVDLARNRIRLLPV